MYNKLLLKLKTNLLTLDNYELVNKILSSNLLISSNAKEILLTRNLSNLELDDEIIEKIIKKLTIEELWYIAKLNINNRFCELVTLKLNKLLDYYQQLNFNTYLEKRDEGINKILKFK